MSEKVLTPAEKEALAAHEATAAQRAQVNASTPADQRVTSGRGKTENVRTGSGRIIKRTTF